MTLKTSKKIGNKLNIGVMTWAFSDVVGKVLLTNFIDILEPLSNKLFVITGIFQENVIFNKKVHIKNIKHVIKKKSTVINVFRYILMQLRISINLIKISRNIDIAIFFLGVSLVLPMIFAKILRKKTILVATSSFQKCSEITYSKMLLGYRGFIYSSIAGFLEKINYVLSDVVVVSAENLVQQLGLRNHRNKILVAHEHFLDFDKFKIKNKFDERECVIGYIGRLSKEKGVLNFAKAISEISEQENEIKFLVGGGGHLRDEIEKYLNEEKLNSKVKLAGWIPHDNLPDYLNELKLIVIPSYTETGPIIMSEAIACGTPVLATPVGSVPNVIKDGETGFILENNSPTCIAENVMRALKHPDQERIVKNARALVEREFTYEAAVEGYRKILENVR